MSHETEELLTIAFQRIDQFISRNFSTSIMITKQGYAYNNANFKKTIMQNLNQTFFMISTFSLSILSTICFGQNVSTTKTQYSQREYGSIGKENYSFSLSNFVLTISDLDYNRSETYGPVKMNESGFDQDQYFETYVPNIEQDPANWRKWNNNIRSYKFIFDKKGGKLIIVVEVKGKSSDSRTIKTYYTEQGRSLIPSSGRGINKQEELGDLSSTLLNANNLADLLSFIKSHYSSDAKKDYSNDMAKYSQTFRSGEKRALASYKVADDKVFQITFLLPKEESTEICKKSFITHFTQRQVDGNAVWVNSKTGLIYEAGFQGEIGIIVVK